MFTSIFALPWFGWLALFGGLALLPVLIHLINMMRHRRVKWAAMEFLLQSYKKHRNWVWLKQLLLLLMRVAAMIFVLLMLAQIGCQNNQLAEFFGGKPVHHYVVLDDSYSMSDRFGNTTAFERARKAIQLIATRAGTLENQKFTLIRYSQAVGGVSGDDVEAEIEQIADINGAVVDKKFDELLEERRNTFDVSQLSVGPRAALQVVEQLVDQRDDEKALVYIVSDFRAKEWDNPSEIQTALRNLKQLKAEVQFVDCVKTAQPNLAVVDVAPESETRAAGVPLFVNVSVKNFGTTAATRVQVKIRSVFYNPVDAASGDPSRIQGDVQELPSVLFEEIAPGETATRRFQIYFPSAGKHVVEASLPDDAVAADNRRWCVIDFLEGVPVLVIDNDPKMRNGYYLSTAFEPGRKNTGIRPDVQPKSFLRDAKPELLAAYHSIYLLDIDQFDERSVNNLETYVRGGGGIAFFVGPHVDLDYYNNKLYKQGAGLFPCPLDRVQTLPETDQKTPDIIAEDHPIFRTFLGERNSFLADVYISRYLKPPLDWSAASDVSVQIAARLRQDGDPLVIDRQVGEGRVVAFLTTIAPDWNNWSRNPPFVVIALKLQGYLAATRRVETPRVVGAPIELQLDAEKYRTDVTFVAPGDDPLARITIDRPAQREENDSLLMDVALGRDSKDRGARDETSKRGVYEAWPITTAGVADVRRYAVNVDTAEGDLTHADSKTLLAKLDTIKPLYVHWDQFDPDPVRESGFSWSRWLLVLMIVLLVLEQVMAYATSYHPVRGGVRS